jgi:hypothetical protein
MLNEIKHLKHGDAALKCILCADTKALWTVLGMGHNGSYPCILCQIKNEEMNVPRNLRDPAFMRTFESITGNSTANLRYVFMKKQSVSQAVSIAQLL